MATASGAYATEIDAGSVMSSEDRAQTIKALVGIRKGQWKEAERQIAATRDPLAAKIYYWLSYTKNANDVPFDRIAAFVKQNPDWPSIDKMRLNAEKNLGKHTSADDLIAWFESYPPLTSEGMEMYLDALARRGLQSKAWDVARGWWKDTLLTTDKQARFLSKYESYLDENAHKVRLGNLLYEGHFTNARIVARILGRGYPALAEARIALVNDKGGVDAKIAAVPPHLMNDPGLAYERLRWRRKNNKTFGALEILHNPPPAEQIPNLADWWKERHIIARRMIEEKQYESAYLLVSKHQQEEGLGFAQAEFLAGWLALRFLEEPWKAFEHFEALYHRTSTPISRARGAYWAGRASEDLGHPEIARKWYHVAARHQTTYYGQLALDKLEDEYKPPQQMQPKRILSLQNAFNRSEMVQTARILNKAGFRRETTAFLDALAASTKTPEDYILVADLAEELDHYHNAVRIAKDGLQKNIFMMDHAYPTILARLDKIDVEWALVHAIIRQESAFDHDAQSPAGARGLMQLMPATATEVARKNGWRHQTGWLTTNPNHNIRLGSAYIKQMINRFDGSYPLAVAAYNGGPGRVDRWLKEIGDPRTGEIDMIDWIELIPVYETRNYVQRVLEGVYVYRIKLRDVQKNADSPIHVALRNSKS